MQDLLCTTLLLLVASTLQVVFCRDTVATEWEKFKAKYNRSYSSTEEEASRLEIFKSNLRIIEEHNAGESSYRLGVNDLADLSVAEYRRLLAPVAPAARPPGHSARSAGVWLWTGGSKDWRDEGAVTPVRYRTDRCGSGGRWAFAAADTVESAWKIAGNPLVVLSEQQLIDCSTDYGTHGCTAGRAEQAFEYLSSSGDGLSKAAEYRYYGGDWESCRSHTGVAHISDWRFTSRANEPELEYVVATVGPTAARIDADHTAFQLYAGGVLHVNHCSTDRPTLAVEVVGFGSEDYFGQLVTYWLIKNSWGPGWGEYGYLKLHKDANNMCGIATDASYPLVG